MLLICQHCDEYNRYMHEQIQNLVAGLSDLPDPWDDGANIGMLNNAMQDLFSLYIPLEEYYMYQSITLAIALDEIHNALTSSFVDDSFFILQKSAQRAGGTGSIQAACACLNHVTAVIGSMIFKALRERIQGTSCTTLNYISCDMASSASVQWVAQDNNHDGVETQHTGFTVESRVAAVAVNNIHLSSEYTIKLKNECEPYMNNIFPSTSDREQIRSCMNDLQAISNQMRQAGMLALEEIAQGLVTCLQRDIDLVNTIQYELDEQQYAEYDVNDPWMQSMLISLEELPTAKYS